MSNDSTVTNILWTGGWDSTFRVCQLTLLEGRRVQPHYIIDPRPSAGVEQETVRKLRELIHQRLNKELIAEPILVNRDDIPENIKVTERIQDYRKQNRLGMQYDWLIRYVMMKGLWGLELCVHKDDRAHPWTTKDEYFMTCFDFPILELTKLDMRAYAQEHNFLDILQQTWFCYSPINGKPCGHCNPCKFTMGEGLGQRIPLIRRIEYRLKLRQSVGKAKFWLRNRLLKRFFFQPGARSSHENR